MTGRILSMTGFGRGAAEFSGGRVVAEVRTLNHRFLEISVRSPRELLFFDPAVRRALKQRVSRGKAEVFLTVERTAGRIPLSLERARVLLQQLRPVADMAGDRVNLDHLLAAAGGATGEASAVEDETGLALAAEAALAAALAPLLAHREAEGMALVDDLRARLGRLGELRVLMEPFVAQALPRITRQVAEFLARWDMAARVDAGRMEAEVVLLAQRSDITEELTRLGAHLEAMAGLLEGEGGGGKGEGVGRRLDFLIQEAGREVNTVGSKAADSALAALVVEAKTELERVREQVQNLE
jgi:uncharacterized protein (TIGR00255 family)